MSSNRSHPKKLTLQESGKRSFTIKKLTLQESGKRSFTINNAYHIDGCPTKFSHKDYTGRYINFDPVHAAKKAFNMLCYVKKIRGQCTLYIEMRETTQGSDGKLFSYHCKRVHLKTPIVLPNRTIHYAVIAKAVTIPTEKCDKSHKSSGRMVSIHSKKLQSKKHPHSHSHSHSPKPKSLTRKITNTIKHTVASLKKSIKSII